MLNFIWVLRFDSQEISPLLYTLGVADYKGPHCTCIFQAKDILSHENIRLPVHHDSSFTYLYKPQISWLIFEMFLINECYPYGNSLNTTISLII